MHESTRRLNRYSFGLLFISALLPLAGIASAALAGGATHFLPLTLPGSPVRPAHAQESGFPLSLIDDSGRAVRLKRPAARIVSLSPSITELVFEAGAGSKLVGVTHYSNYPESARSIPEVGDASNLDLERIVALKPDLVIAWRSGNAISDIAKLEKLGLSVFATEATRLEDIPRLLRNIGYLSGSSLQAEASANRFEEALLQMRRASVSRPPVKVFQLIWHQPMMTVSGRHLMSDVAGLCGGLNVFASSPFLTPVISAEDLLKADPDVIISTVSRDFAEIEVEAGLRRFPRMRAVERNHLYAVHPDLMHRQTPRLIEAARAVCDALEQARATLADKPI